MQKVSEMAGAHQHNQESSFQHVLRLSPKGTKVNSQGRKPLETGMTTSQNPNGVKVVWMRHQTRARVVDKTGTPRVLEKRAWASAS